MTSLLKKLSIFIKIGVIKHYGVCFGQFQNCRPNPSAVVVNCVHTADADATKQFRRVGVGGVYWALGHYNKKAQLTPRLARDRAAIWRIRLK